MAKFADTLEKVTVATIEEGKMTKDLSLLVGPDQQWLSTLGFLDAIDANLQKAVAASGESPIECGCAKVPVGGLCPPAGGEPPVVVAQGA